MAFIEIRDLSFSYPGSPCGKALEGINLDIEEGEYITICGRSGGGKTTLLKHMKPPLSPHGSREGEVLYKGKDISGLSLREQAAEIGFVMQDPESQIVTDKVWHELAFGLESLGTDQDEMRARVAEMAAFFGIQDWFHRDTHSLSGGQKQLLNLASIMVMDPELILLDEPTSQLDPIAASEFLAVLKRINLELGTTVIITEHRLEEVFHSSDRVAVMDDGRLLFCEKPEKAAKELIAMGEEMLALCPTPMQVYYGLGELAPAGGDKVPVTLREGRGWLRKFVEDKEIKPSLSTMDKEVFSEKRAICLKEIYFRYEKNQPDVLKGLSLAIPQGSFFAIVGGNGSGKTTLLSAVCGLVRPQRGHVYVHGKRLDKYGKGELFRNNLAMLPQDPRNLFAKKTLKEELEEMVPAGAQGEELVEEALELCELKGLLERHPFDLSGGEQQKAALAKLLLTDPKIILLDEPTKGLDNIFKKRFADILGKLKERGVTIIMVSHDLEFCGKYADMVAMLFDGEIAALGSPSDFFSANKFYTTAAARMSRGIIPGAVTVDEVINLCREIK